jgi:hypothetical protein
MYRAIRNIHLCLGLFSVVFLLMYGISAVQMSHTRWFRTAPVVSQSEVRLAPGQDARAAAFELMATHNVRGELTQVRSHPAGAAFRVTWPGRVHEVVYTQATGIARVRTSTAGFIGMLNRLHHLAGLRHSYGLLNLWGFFVVLISVILIGLGFSGVYLWFKTYDERRVGGLLLAGSLGFGITVLTLMRTA